jgi:hypothetical protein
LLARKARLARCRKIAEKRFEVFRFAARCERRFELELIIEVILDHALVAAGDENEMLDAGGSRFVDDMLQNRPVDDRQHFLRNGFGGGKESRSKSSDRKYGFSNGPDRGVHFMLRRKIIQLTSPV